MPPDEPRDRHVIVDGFRLHLLDWDGDGPPLLFLHGGALTAHSWDFVCRELRARYRCLALDQRGHGDSEWSPELDYGVDAHVRDIAGVVAVLELGRPVLIGQSLGAINALSVAARHPDLPAALVLVDAAPWVRRDGARRVADFVLAPAELPSVEDFVERAVRFNPRREPALLRRSLRHNLRRLPNGMWTWKYDRRHLSSERFDEFAASLPELERLIPEIRCPTLVVRGEESDVLTGADAQRLASALPNGRAVSVPGAGHTVQGDNPEGLAAELREFLTAPLS
jgi:esterase